VAATRLIAMHLQKNRSIQQCIKDRTDYAENGEKTDHGEFISSYECDPKTVDGEFATAKNEYEINTGRTPKEKDVIAYQIRQSFKPGEVDAEKANKIGYETAMRFTKGKHAFIVATHVDKSHIHNHVIFNSTCLDERHKFNNFFFSGIALQRLSDIICLEHGLSVIKPRRPSEREKRTTYPERKSFREEIRAAIDAALLKKPKDLEEFLKLLREEGYEVKRGKYIAVKGEGQKTFLRLRSLGAGYRDEDINKILTGEVKHTPQKTVGKSYEPQPKKLDMLLDIQEIIAKGKGPGYERWAKLHNVKQVSQTLIFLKEHGIRDYEELAKIAGDASAKFGEITTRQKALEARLIEIAALKKHIINYSKTKDVFAEYRKSGYSKKFFEEHREALTLYKAAKDAFKQIEGPIPKIRELNAEYEEVLKQKKLTYAEYKQAQKEMKDYQTAKYNIDQFMRKQSHERDEHQRNRSHPSL